MRVHTLRPPREHRGECNGPRLLLVPTLPPRLHHPSPQRVVRAVGEEGCAIHPYCTTSSTFTATATATALTLD